jgi:hypothetical protein
LSAYGEIRVRGIENLPQFLHPRRVSVDIELAETR